jgi:ribosomal protein S16
LNTDSGKSRKVFSLKPESVFNLNQNRCSDWIRMGVQVEPEYARELLRKDKALAEAAALLVLQKKFRALLGGEVA